MKAVIYTKPSCPFCHKAKDLLTKRSIEFEEIDVSENSELRDKVSRENGNWSTVPMVFLDDKFIGGYNDLVGHFDKSKSAGDKDDCCCGGSCAL